MTDTKIEIAIMYLIEALGISKKEIQNGAFSMQDLNRFLPIDWESNQIAYKQQIMFGAMLFK